ncbi:MAG: diguanylate cyclase [Thermoleophilia bacterium]|nr:diguanylate cyclase [Thermoleophilia bacterium]
MEGSPEQTLARVADALEGLLTGSIPDKLEYSGASGTDVENLCAAVNQLIDMQAEAREFMLSLSEGRLDADAPRGNFLISPFKQMQSNLRHLVWQTGRIAQGDLNQHVDFLGEFSDSFNSMIASLREKRAIEEALEASEKRLKDITSALGEGVYMLDSEGQLVFLNPAAERMLGWSEEELLGKTVHGIIHSRKPDGSRYPDDDCLALQTLESGMIVHVQDDIFIRKDDSVLPVSFISTPILEYGIVSGAVVAFHDITTRKNFQEALARANALLEQQATTDALTGIANRRRFDDALIKEISRAGRHSEPLSVVMLDIDHFKAVNDTYGHHVGDLVLTKLAQLVSALLRDEDLFARWGGEEFVVLLPQTPLAAGAEMAERLRRAVENDGFSSVDKLTCSFGVTSLGPDDDEKSLMERTDQALYKAKESGRNCVTAEECY